MDAWHHGTVGESQWDPSDNNAGTPRTPSIPSALGSSQGVVRASWRPACCFCYSLGA